MWNVSAKNPLEAETVGQRRRRKVNGAQHPLRSTPLWYESSKVDSAEAVVQWREHTSEGSINSASSSRSGGSEGPSLVSSMIKTFGGLRRPQRDAFHEPAHPDIHVTTSLVQTVCEAGELLTAKPSPIWMSAFHPTHASPSRTRPHAVSNHP